jgi:hypothetical protein
MATNSIHVVASRVMSNHRRVRLWAGIPIANSNLHCAASTAVTHELRLVRKQLKRTVGTMKATALLRDFGQSLWLDNITRDLLNNGTLEHYINDLSITGLTSNPTIFDHAVKNSAAYDSAILDASRRGKGGETVFFDLALKDITRAADLIDRNYDCGCDGDTQRNPCNDCECIHNSRFSAFIILASPNQTIIVTISQIVSNVVVAYFRLAE